MNKKWCLPILFLVYFVSLGQGQTAIIPDSTKSYSGQNSLGGGANPPSPKTDVAKPDTSELQTENYALSDSPVELERFKTLGLSIVLLVFSIYLFYVSTKIYLQYLDKKVSENYFTYICYGCIVIFNFLWVIIILEIKNISPELLSSEFLRYPNQFVFGVLLSSLLLLAVGIFRFTLIALIPSDNTEEMSKDKRFAIIGILFSILGAIANILKIKDAF